MLSEKDIIDYCLTFDGACVRYPYGDIPLVLSTAEVHEFGEAYEGTAPFHIVLKSDPDKAIALRKQYPENIKEGYRCNKKYWNSVYIDSRLPDSLVKEMLRDSYELASKLNKKKKVQPDEYMPTVVPNTPKEFEF